MPGPTYDVKKQRKELYAPRPGDFEIVEVPSLGFLMVDGHGDPNTSIAYREAVESLYERLHRECLPARGLVPTGRHHEIYLSDARRIEPARLRTILRQPVSG